MNDGFVKVVNLCEGIRSEGTFVTFRKKCQLTDFQRQIGSFSVEHVLFFSGTGEAEASWIDCVMSRK